MTKVMQADIIKSGQCADSCPRLLQVYERLAFALSGNDEPLVAASFLKVTQYRYSLFAEGNHESAILSIRQAHEFCVKVNPLPL